MLITLNCRAPNRLCLRNPSTSQNTSIKTPFPEHFIATLKQASPCQQTVCLMSKMLLSGNSFTLYCLRIHFKRLLQVYTETDYFAHNGKYQPLMWQAHSLTEKTKSPTFLTVSLSRSHTHKHTHSHSTLIDTCCQLDCGSHSPWCCQMEQWPSEHIWAVTQTYTDTPV